MRSIKERIQICLHIASEMALCERFTPGQVRILEFLYTPPPGDPFRPVVIAAFRGMGKSTLAQLVMLERLDDNPDLKCAYISKTAEFAQKASSWCMTATKRVPYLNHLAPDTRDGRYSVKGWDVGCITRAEPSPSVSAHGIQNQITGTRANMLIVDDIETPLNSKTHSSRDELRVAVDELVAVGKPQQENGSGGCQTVVLGTFHSTTESIYLHYRKKCNAHMMLWPARVPEREDLSAYMGCLADPIMTMMERGLHGRPTDTRFNESVLLTKEAGMTPGGWRMQYQLNPAMQDEEKYPLKIRNLAVVNVNQQLPEVVVYQRAPEFAIREYEAPGHGQDNIFYRAAEVKGTYPADRAGSVMALDPAGGGKDEFAWSVMRTYNGNFFLQDIGGQAAEATEEFYRMLAEKAQFHKVKAIAVETNFGDLQLYRMALESNLKDIGYPCSVEEFKSGGMRKERRIAETLCPITQMHRLFIDEKVVEEDCRLIAQARDEEELSHSLFYQYTRLSEEDNSLLHDDRIDVVHMACAYFQEQVQHVQHQNYERRNEEYMYAMLPEHITGRKTVITLQRRQMGMTLEQAKEAAMLEGAGTRDRYSPVRGWNAKVVRR